jgi:hypothetical protein
MVTRKKAKRTIHHKTRTPPHKSPGMTKAEKAGERREIRDARKIKTMAERIIKGSERELKEGSGHRRTPHHKIHHRAPVHHRR